MGDGENTNPHAQNEKKNIQKRKPLYLIFIFSLFLKDKRKKGLRLQ